MKRLRLMSYSLAFSGLAATASAQSLDIVIDPGSSWVLNTSSSQGPGSVIVSYNPPPGFPCQSTDNQFARVDYDIRLTLGFNSQASVAAKYGGSNHAGCVLDPVSASASKSGYASFVHSPGTGTFEFDITSHAGANATNAHADGDATSDFTITLYGIYINPPQITPPYQVTRTNSSSISGTDAPIINQFADLVGTKSNKNNFTVTVAVNGDASVSLPSELINNPGALGVVWAQPNPNSVINLY